VVAGCSGTSDDGPTATPIATAEASTTGGAASTETVADSDTEPPRTEQSTTARETPRTGDLDLREANVVGVEFERSGDAYRFSVTLYHDDDGEDGYANWWQVETLDGTRLGRRDLLHAHSTAPFTRSETVSVPADTGDVVVRGHDQTHGYGGQAVVVDLETGTTHVVAQGPEPRDLSAFDPD
jgi:hypothetical protein